MAGLIASLRQAFSPDVSSEVFTTRKSHLAAWESHALENLPAAYADR